MRRALLLLPVLLPLLAQAQTLDMNQGGPVEITADDGIEWRQQEQVVVARGNARAVRDGVTVDADRLIARYRPRGGAAAQPQRPGENPTSGSEIWRLEAEGNVRINSATEQARGTRAVYDMDQSVLVLSGAGLSLTTPEQRITARDTLEYWPARRMAVARGDAVVLSQDGRQVAADTLVGLFLDAPDTPAAPAQPRTSVPGLPGGGGNSRIDRVEAYGNVEIRTAEEVVRGERGVYSPQTGLARLLGQVRITRGENQLNGQEAIVNLQTGVSRLVSAPGQRVQGLVVPQQDQPDRATVPPPQRPQPRTDRPPLPQRPPAQ